MAEPIDKNRPRVAVLLASFNGLQFIAEQIDSILNQEGCATDIWVSDDHSTDGTWEWLRHRSENDSRLLLLPRKGRFGSAARNFYRLLDDVDATSYSYIALADQDDIWFETKLLLSIRKLHEHSSDAFSSNVLALWQDGRRRLIRKSQRQRRLDFLFESAGQGCTYVFTARCATAFQQFLRGNRSEIEKVQFHDWMMYAWCRSRSFRWYIEPTPTLLYRQHGDNVHGVNSGWHALRSRMAMVRSGWYRKEILKIAHLIREGPMFTQECAATIRLVERRTILSKAMLALKSTELRRKWKDRGLLLISCLLLWI